jgi:glycosyltransferase involved in cell wall biosynthesis
MRITVDTTSLLLRSAGVKNHIHYLVLALLREASARGDEICIYPPAGPLPSSLDHEKSFDTSLAMWSRFLLVQFCNVRWNPAIDVLLAGSDVFHCSQHTANPIRRRALTATLFDLSCWKTPECHTPANIAATRRYAERILKSCDGIIANSTHARNDAVEILGIPQERMRVIHPGVAESFFDAALREPGKPAATYGLEGPYLLFVGCVEPRKNVPGLLRAYRQLPERVRRGLPLVIAGPFGWAGDEIRAMLAADSRVKYLGYVPESDLPQVYAGATAFVFPSFYEGFGLPVAQAMAAGIPVVASNRSALPEVVGDAGLLVDPDSTEELSAAIERVATCPQLAAELVQRGRARARDFHWAAAAARSMDFFHEVGGSR